MCASTAFVAKTLPFFAVCPQDALKASLAGLKPSELEAKAAEYPEVTRTMLPSALTTRCNPALSAWQMRLARR